MPNNINPNNNGSYEEGMKIISYCPICHYHYNPTEARILEENENAHLIHIKCQRCKSSILALVMFNNFGISSIGLVTDLEGHEIAKFKDLESVTADDVLDIYQVLSTSGSYHAIFK